ncbi:MAG: murein biosynthesis integral membrane protein MurJ [Anaerolineales bacterium]|nr:murein biosynthesis integral membrane protein MurJ [Anaerolineales bacterium]
MRKLSHLTRTSLMLGMLFALDKVVAFFRSVIIARQFSLSSELDAFNVANNLPDLLFALISGGALAMAFIPLLSEYLTSRGRPATWDLFSRVANLAFTVTAGLAVFIAVFADQIVQAEIGIAPGYTPEQQGLVAELMRLNLIATLIFSISGLVMAGLQANQHFVMPAIAPLLYNIGQIFGAVILSPSEPYAIGPLTLPAFGLGVHGLVYGVILGAALHLAIQIPALIRYGFRWTPALNIRHTGLLEALKLIAPRLLTMFGIQLMFIARDNLASRLDQVGAASVLTYGWMIMQVPETLLGTAIATALLPTLAEYAARQEWATFRETVEKATRVLVALTIPVAAVIAAGLRPLTAVVFGFDDAGTDLLTWTTRAYLIVLVGYSLHEVMVRAFYARKEPLFPLWGVLIRLSIYLVIGVLAVTVLRAQGAPVIALAEIAITIEALVLFFWLNRRLPERVTAWVALRQGLLAAVISGALAYALAVYLPGPGVVTALVGMVAGGLVALPFIWKEIRLLFTL